MKKVLLLGASGLIAPHIIPALEPRYDLRLADIKPHPDGKPVMTVDVTDYAQVLEAARGMDAIMNFTVNRPHPELSFSVNTRGACYAMKAAAELGIKKVLHTGPLMIIGGYDHDFDIPEAPPTPGSGYYFVTKRLGFEICKIYARTYDIHTVCFLFYLLGPKPAEAVSKRSIHPFTIVYDDLAYACRLALDLGAVPDYFQEFHLHSYPDQNKYSLDKANRMLGYEPQEDVAAFFRRVP